MNTKRYLNRALFWTNVSLVITAAFAAGMIAVSGHIWTALILLALFGWATARRMPTQCFVTLSVPEIMMDVLDAFKLEIPELFGPDGFATDFSSKTAVLGDKITAHISQLPVTGAYDPNNGGFKAAAQDVTTLIADVPVTLNQFRIVTIKVGWLTQLSSKLPLYREAIRNYGYVLAKYVIDTCLQQVTAANFSNAINTGLVNINLDTMDTSIRTQLNAQKTYDKGRFMLCGSKFANQLGSDDRVRSSLFYGMLNGNNGYRLYRNLAGFSWVREYPDFPTAGNLLAFGADKRAITVAVRRPDFSTVQEDLGVPRVMEFHTLTDDESGLDMTGASWQEVGTGDVYISAGILFGVSAGNQGGGANTVTDQAGLMVTGQ